MNVNKKCFDTFRNPRPYRGKMDPRHPGFLKMQKSNLFSRMGMCTFYALKNLKIKVIKKSFEVLEGQKHTLQILYINEKKIFSISEKIEYL